MLTNIVNRPIVAAQQQKRAGSVKRQNRLQVLDLPVLGHRMPHADLPGRRQRHQLAADEEQIFNAHVQAKHADI